jgi:hypothetical protein
MSCSAFVVPQVFSMSMVQFDSVLDVSDAESASGVKRGVIKCDSSFIRKRLVKNFCGFVLDVDLLEVEAVRPLY